MKPHVENAPGLTWRKLKHKWEARWRARESAIRRGYPHKTVCVWQGNSPGETERAYISSRCVALQHDMLSKVAQH